MNGSLYNELGRREGQIMDVVYRLEEAGAETIRTRLPDPPSNSATRSMLRHLEEKGYLDHRQEGRRYVYFPTRPKEEVRRSLLDHLQETFFGGSLSETVATLLSAKSEDLSPETLRELEQIVEDAHDSSESSEAGSSKTDASGDP
ncbi:putative transcriptional regulator [Salinibacter ruber]|jgi:predicted transcriptional regulator|uniref:Transcriptional regulator, BlaI/MecI/CopY family n=2 Tax=Salinibacter ruber TaxID=146919 RepID=Q2S5T7_SALRD|nr:BlaI/MecI/CopY family transcriptional regulator [Salinibacter ruber]ABC46246.1 transcriptional regulator, BlaI/MecI/CopY family [Salinibacter ruber DSM 13855]MBB4061613.1 putative transcriptional regulator [Salinibacter ruber]MBB4070115.1 putative transcriptional regulator [Salinibacter ruber]MCS3635208.1 putative transcriptional regulator [Salinibacter ruber]MCS3637856.1 putative transcriptional regulator [Salinibacter ruber]